MIRAPLVITPLQEVPTIVEGDDLPGIILDAARRSMLDLADYDVIAIAQKIVSKAEGRAVRLSQVTPSARAIDLATASGKDPRVVELILRESTDVLRCRPGAIIVVHRLGFVAANAGIDASNVESEGIDEAVLMLPNDPDRSAAAIRHELYRRTGKTIGILINDSFGRAWRMGTVGTAIGAAGIPALMDLRGKPDRTGRPLQSTEVGLGDELAAAASLMMGQAGEGLPIVHVRGFPYEDCGGQAADLIRPRHLDLFR
jgi:coenzyme F420-0:L-glutamate ligase/coenzyme F420-1:gamma-L-glutamate ligase